MRIATARQLGSVGNERACLLGGARQKIIACKHIVDGAPENLGLEEELKGLATGKRAPAFYFEAHYYSLGKTSPSMHTSTRATETPTWASIAWTTASRTTSASFLNG